MHRIEDQFINGGFTWFTGVVEDVDDPEKMNRVKVRCFGYHTDDLGKIPTRNLPWATVMMPNTSASISGIGTNHRLMMGSWVVGFFRDGPSAQDPIVLGSIASSYDKEPNKKRGFSNRSEDLPRLQQDETEYPINDTNFRARGIAETPRVVDAVIDEPESPYGAIYAYIQVIESESGHVIEIDDTPSAERIRIKHRSGTFVEMHPNGDIVTAHNNGWRSVTGNDSLHVTGNVTIVVDGNADIDVGGNVNLDVVGDTDVSVGRDASISVVGDMSVECPSTTWTGDISLTGNISISGTSTATGDHVSAGISGKGHVHTEQGDGKDVSSPK